MQKSQRHRALAALFAFSIAPDFPYLLFLCLTQPARATGAGRTVQTPGLCGATAVSLASTLSRLSHDQFRRRMCVLAQNGAPRELGFSLQSSRADQAHRTTRHLRESEEYHGV